jgi:hypothetical protein
MGRHNFASRFMVFLKMKMFYRSEISGSDQLAEMTLAAMRL